MTIRRGTALLALRWQDKTGIKVLIASDSQITVDDTTKITSDDPDAKLVRFPNFTVGVSGSGPVKETLDSMKKLKRFKELHLRTESQAHKFAAEAFGRLEKLIDRCPRKTPEDEVGELLIATRSKIFVVFSDLTMITCPYYAAAGSGGDSARPAAMVLYSLFESQKKIATWEDLEDIAMRSIDVACKLDPNCSGPVRIVRVC